MSYQGRGRGRHGGNGGRGRRTPNLSDHVMASLSAAASSYKLSIYIKREASEIPTIEWDEPENKKGWLTQTIEFPNYVNRTRPNTIPIYYLEVDGIPVCAKAQAYSEDEIKCTHNARMGYCELILPPNRTSSNVLQIEIARKYPDLTPKQVATVTRITGHKERLEDTSEKLQRKLERLNAQISDMETQINKITNGTCEEACEESCADLMLEEESHSTPCAEDPCSEN